MIDLGFVWRASRLEEALVEALDERMDALMFEFAPGWMHLIGSYLTVIEAIEASRRHNISRQVCRAGLQSIKRAQLI